MLLDRSLYHSREPDKQEEGEMGVASEQPAVSQEEILLEEQQTSPVEHQPPPPLETPEVPEEDTPAGIQPDQPDATETTPSTPPVAPATASAMRCCRILTLTFLMMFTVMSVVAVFVLESELDMPVLRDIRQMPEVQDFKHQHYNPFKTTVAQRMGGWFK